MKSVWLTVQFSLVDDDILYAMQTETRVHSTKTLSTSTRAMNRQVLVNKLESLKVWKCAVLFFLRDETTKEIGSGISSVQGGVRSSPKHDGYYFFLELSQYVGVTYVNVTTFPTHETDNPEKFTNGSMKRVILDWNDTYRPTSVSRPHTSIVCIKSPTWAQINPWVRR